MDTSNAKVPGRKGRILVVEDDRASSTALNLLLRHHGYEVLMARTVADAIKLAASQPDFILLDLMLPDGDGIEVLEFSRDRQIRSAVTVITGSSDPERLARVQGLGPMVLLQKPIDFLDILRNLPQPA
jgi:DNA-binding response OmpR family regulator